MPWPSTSALAAALRDAERRIGAIEVVIAGDRQELADHLRSCRAATEHTQVMLSDMAEAWRRMHAESQASIAQLSAKLDVEAARFPKWLLGCSMAFNGALISAIAFVLYHGLPWAHP
jgi:hypothetical protein